MRCGSKGVSRGKGRMLEGHEPMIRRALASSKMEGQKGALRKMEGKIGADRGG